MGHNLEQLGTASLDTFGGLITAANPTDLPEGASPRCWDVDFIIGSVFTRAGLKSVYTYTQVLTISQVVVYGNVATFTYAGAFTPTINEGFFLSGFIGAAYFLNGLLITVVSVNAALNTFTVNLQGTTATYSGQNGTATSVTGSFTGPNAPNVAASVGTGNLWQNPNNVLGDTSYASVTSGTTNATPQTPTTAASIGVPGATTSWDVPANLLSVSTPANLTLSAAQVQDPVVAYGGPLSVPTTANITGIQVTFKAKSSVFGTSSLNVQLFNPSTNTTYGTPENVPLGTSFSPCSPGSPNYQWGTTLTAADVNNGNLGVQLSGLVSSGTATISAYDLVITVSYGLSGSAAELQTTSYTFSVPATTGITGFLAAFQAYSSSNTTIILQMLKNGIAVGNPKPQVLTTSPTVYTLGDANDLWDTTWLYSDVNNTQFGVEITATGNGVTFINDLDLLVYITPALVNFNYIKSYVQNNGQTYTLALDASGILWQENVTSSPDILAVALTGILPGSFAQSSTMDNREHIMFSDLSIGTERPRVYNGATFRPLSQTGPGAPPTFTAVSSSAEPPLEVTSYSVSGTVVTFTFNAVSSAPTIGALYTLNGTNNVNLDGRTVSVLGTPAPTTTQFSSAAGSAVGSASGLSASASPTNVFGVASITQNSTTTPPPAGQPAAGPFSGNAALFNGQEQLWGAGPGLTGPGTVYTNYYSGANAPENYGIQNSAQNNYPIYVYIDGAYFANGTQLVATHTTGIPPSETALVPFFTVTATTSGNARHGGPNNNFGPGNMGTFQLTLATVTTVTPIPSIGAGDSVTISGASPSQWNATWTVVNALDSGAYNITSSQAMGGGVVQFQYSSSSAFGEQNVTVGQTISLSGLVNNLSFNTVGVVSATPSGSLFQISGFSGSIQAQGTPTPENGQGVTFGQVFLIDPGSITIGTNTNPIYGNTTVGGQVAVVGGAQIPIGVGVRQGAVYFITDNQYETQPSAPFEFTTPSGTEQIQVTNIPIGPPNTIARALIFTEAGQNSVPGANFYVIEEPVNIPVGDATVTIPSTIINDNVTTQIALAFTDAVLLNSREVDVQGDDLFNLIELGSSGWAVPYADRMFYGLQLNKINNWTSGGGLTFDGGYLPNGTSNIQPLGWSTVNSVDQTLVTSAVTGQSLYIKNTNVTTQTVGMIFQTAYQDAYNVAIIQPNTAYSVRVAARAPSGITGGTLTIDLTNNLPGTGFGQTFGTFTVPLTSMSTVDQVFIGSLLNSEFTSSVPSTLVIRVYLANAAPGADCEIDRIEVFPTQTPFLKSQVYGSYPGQPEAIDASSTGGIIDTASENAQPCMGAFVMRDLLFILKTNSMYSTQDNPNSEPGGWGLHEVSNKVGAVGINSYDVGEEWALMACRAGIFGFNGGQPTKISQEMWNLWEQINWNAGNTIVLRNDIVNKRMYCAIPLPTGVNPATGIPANKYTNVWLPNAPYNPTPTTPNVMLMLNYQGLATFEEMISSPEVHTTMFGTLAAVDMKRKWTIWNIATPAMQFIIQPDAESAPLYICNGIGTSKIYELGDQQYSDDGVAINSLYTTYGFVNAAKAATLPIFGFHAKRYTVLQTTIYGGQDTPGSFINPTNAMIRILPNTLTPRYPYTVPVGIPLVNPAEDDYFRPINVRGNRAFVEISTNSVGSWFNISKLLLTGKADAWSTLNPTGGGNSGIV